MNDQNKTKLLFFGTFIFGIIIGFIWSSAISTMVAIAMHETSPKLIAQEKIKNKDYDEALLIKGTITNVHDGDTVTVNVSKQFNIRLLDCWAPEINSKDENENKRGLASKEFLNKMIKNGDEVTVEIPIYENFAKSLTFGRFLGYIWRDIDGDGVKDNISNEMVKNNYATKTKNN